jgi:hypothetical protein
VPNKAIQSRSALFDGFQRRLHCAGKPLFSYTSPFDSASRWFSIGAFDALEKTFGVFLVLKKIGDR